jgi:hypothetical protein
MALQKGAFDHEAYNAQYGPALSQIAGYDAVDQAGGVDADYNPDQEQDIQAHNVSNQSVAPLPSPLQQQRSMDRAQPPPPAKLGGGKNDPTSPQSSGAFYDDPNGPHQSAPIYHATSQLSDAQLKALEKEHDDARGAKQDDHGVPDMDTIYKHTFEDQLRLRAQQRGGDEAAAKIQPPTWREKATMFLDAANRAGAIHAQNPQMSQGDIWAVATRGALDGYEAHVQGAHDAYINQQQAFRDQAESDAKDAVKRAGDQFGFQQKADQLIELRKREAETERHNRATEANTEDKNASTADKESREAAKGDLVTLDKDMVGADGKTIPAGSMVRIDAKGKVTRTGASGTKTGTKAPNAGEDEKATKDAQAAYDKAEAAVEKDEAAKAKDPMNLGKPTMSAEEKAARAKEILRTQNPKAYKALYPDEKDEPMADKKPAGNPAVDNSPWRQRAKQ